MNDSEIVGLYFARSDKALTAASEKYAPYCQSIAMSILNDPQDAEECVNDAFLRAWNSIPPHKPERLSTFLGKITRNLSISKFKQRNAQKRGGGEIPLVLSELNECIPDSNNPEKESESAEISAAINSFLETLPAFQRTVFVRRYWYLTPVKEIARMTDTSESKIKSMLMRTRSKLKIHLEKEGITL